MDAEGRVRIVSQATRDQGRNLEDARDKLAELIREALHVPRPRRPTKPTRSSQRRRVDDKRRESNKKQLRGRVRGKTDRAINASRARARASCMPSPPFRELGSGS